MRARYHLMVDWQGDDSFSSPYDDVTRFLVNLECRHGRDYASQLTGKATAGKLTAFLHNPLGLFAMMNQNSPLYGSLLPGRKVQLIMSIGGGSSGESMAWLSPYFHISTEDDTEYVLWTGYLSDIIPQKPLYQTPIVELSASGGLEKMRGVQVIPGAQQDKMTGELVNIVLDSAGWGPERSIDSGQTQIGRWFVDKKNALNAIRDIEETELGFFYEDAIGGFVFEDRHHRLKGDSLISQAAFVDDGSGDCGFRDIEYNSPLRDIFNDVTAIVSPMVVNAGKVLWSFREDPLPTLAPGQSLTWWAEYPNAEIDLENGAYVEEWFDPVIGTDIVVSGISPGELQAEVLKFANSAKITLTNNGTVTAILTKFQLRGIPVRYVEPVRVSQEDIPSQNIFGKSTYELTGKWLPNTNVARDFCNYIIQRYKKPSSIIRLSYKASKNGYYLEQAGKRKISDRITVKSLSIPFGIDGEYFIEAISHRLTNWGKTHEVFYDLSDATGDSGYWILGIPGFSELGQTTILSY